MRHGIQSNAFDECDAFFLFKSKLKHHKTKHHVASQTPSETAVDHKSDEISNTTESSEEKEQMNDSQSALVDESILMNKSIGKNIRCFITQYKKKLSR